MQMYVMGRLLMSGYTGFSAYIPENKISVAIMVNGLASFPAQELCGIFIQNYKNNKRNLLFMHNLVTCI